MIGLYLAQLAERSLSRIDSIRGQFGFFVCTVNINVGGMDHEKDFWGAIEYCFSGGVC
jgi:hypothetical protein